MSHYAVLVLHEEEQNIEDMLAPYNENLEVEPYLKYTIDEGLKYVKEEYVPYNDYMKDYSDKQLIEWLSKNDGYILRPDGFYTTYNPNSKWDWWQIGGRFSSKLVLTDEAVKTKYPNYSDYSYTSSAPLSCIEWFHPLTEEEKNKIRRKWEIYIYNYPLKEGEEKDKYFFYNSEYYKARYKDVETDIKLQEMTRFYAIVTPDGMWHAPAQMGWFGCSLGKPDEELEWDLNFYNNFIKDADKNLIATVVDCHI